MGEELTGAVGETSGGSGEDLRLRLVEEFAAFGPAYMRWVKSQAIGGGISYARMRLLGVLHCGGPRIMSGLGDELGVTPRNVTALVDGLEEEGLVRRSPHPTDRRATIIEMTPHGARACGKRYEEHPAAVAEVFDALSGEEQGELLRLLGTLRGALREKGISG